MFDEQIIAYLRYVHGVFNSLVGVGVIVLARWGLQIRRSRLQGRSDSNAIRRHRAWGPLIALLSWTGYAAGSFLVFIGNGRPLVFPLHAVTGLAIVILVTATFLVSRRLSRKTADLRNFHYRLGIGILVLYGIQFLLGLGILL